MTARRRTRPGRSRAARRICARFSRRSGRDQPQAVPRRLGRIRVSLRHPVARSRRGGAVDIASSVKVVIRQALLAEYRVGKGRLIVSGFKFHDDDPASVYLKAQILAYAASDRFEPKASISPERLAAVIDAPIVTGSADTNRANDTNAN